MAEKGWFLYLLRCADGSFYTGVTTDLERRVREHNAGRGSRYTAGRRPVWIAGAWPFPDRASAQRAEARLRRLDHRRKEELTLAGAPFAGAPFHGPTPLRFCPRCGGRLEVVIPSNTDPPHQVCTECGRLDFRNPKPCAGALVVREGKVMLVRRRIEPFKGYWDIPGGFLEDGEHPERCAVRELEEETGLKVRITELLGFYIDQYTYQGESGTTLNLYFLAEPVGGTERPGDDAAEIGWFGPDSLPRRLAFSHVPFVLAEWSRRVKK